MWQDIRFTQQNQWPSYIQMINILKRKSEKPHPLKQPEITKVSWGNTNQTSEKLM